MRTVLTVAGITLAVVITAVAGVYAWMALAAEQTTAGLPVPPPKAAKAPPRQAAAPRESRSSASSSTSARTSSRPQASQVLVRPGSPPTARAAGAPGQEQPAIPLPEPPAGIPVPVPATEPGQAAPLPETMLEKLAALMVGLPQPEVAAIMGGEGRPVADATRQEFTPLGWYRIRWSDPGGATIVGLFSEQGILAHLEPLKIAGAFDWMNADVHYSITTWINDNLQAEDFPVRLPAVEAATTGPNTFQYQGALVNSEGRFVGSMRGTYYVGDGATTFAPNDAIPYVKAIEGSYQFISPDSLSRADSFGWVEH